MAAVTEILEDVRVFLGDLDLALSLTKVEVSTSVEEKDVTTFRVGDQVASVPNTAKLQAGGLESSAVKLEGNNESGALPVEGKPDDTIFGNLGMLTPFTFMPSGSAAGDPAIFMHLTPTKISEGISVGDIWTYQVDATGSLAHRGVVLKAPAAVVSGGASSGLQVGAVPEGGRLSMSVHVVSSADDGGTIEFSVESSVDDTFASPTEVLNTGVIAGNGGSIVMTDGSAITDTYYRAVWDIAGGSGGSFFVVVSIAID
jgi:hypothetical protein